MSLTTKPRSIRPTVGRLWMLLLLFFTLPALALTGCGDSGSPDQPRVDAGAQELLPSESAQDWATFVDHLATVHLVAVEATPMSPEEKEAGEGLIGREITLAVDQVLWSRRGAPPAPDRFSGQGGGWWVNQEGDKTEWNIRGGPRIRTGHEFLIPVVHGPAGWGPLTSATVYAYDNQQIGNGPARIGPPEPSWINHYRGDNAEAVADQLSKTPPAPEVKGLMNAGLYKRLRATQNP